MSLPPYLEYGPLAFMFWDDIERELAWQPPLSPADQALFDKSIAYSNSAFYRDLKKRRAASNG